MAAHAAPTAHPGTAAAAARQYPSGVPLPGQGLPAHRPAAGPQGASRHTKLCPQYLLFRWSGCSECMCLVVQVAGVHVSVCARAN